MATTPEYLEFVLEQLPPLWSIRSRKMFGEYMIYLNSDKGRRMPSLVSLLFPPEEVS